MEAVQTVQEYSLHGLLMQKCKNIYKFYSCLYLSC